MHGRAGNLRAAGGVDMLARGLRPVLDLVQFPADLLPLCLTRPLSGSATIGLFADVVKTFGPDSLLARMAGTVLGSTETTFYVIAVYFGSVSVRKTRHAVAAGRKPSKVYLCQFDPTWLQNAASYAGRI